MKDSFTKGDNGKAGIIKGNPAVKGKQTPEYKGMKKVAGGKK
jgi:hypothetical protein